MAKAETAAARAPRGTKPVSQAFFAALDSVPDIRRDAVAKAAYAMIRDELKTRREKAKVAAAKAKAASKAAPPAPKKAAARPKPEAEPEPVPAKRRTRKTAEIPGAA